MWEGSYCNEKATQLLSPHKIANAAAQLHRTSSSTSRSEPKGWPPYSSSRRVLRPRAHDRACEACGVASRWHGAPESRSTCIRDFRKMEISLSREMAAPSGAANVSTPREIMHDTSPDSMACSTMLSTAQYASATLNANPRWAKRHTTHGAPRGSKRVKGTVP